MARRSTLNAGTQYGKLTTISPDPEKRGHWLCRCECGEPTTVKGGNLTAGRTKSCGCLRRTHGLSSNSAYDQWRTMKRRCDNNEKGYEKITYDPRWADFSQFLLDMGERPEGLSLERVNRFRDYNRANCVWATPTVQANNRKGNQIVYSRLWQGTIPDCARALRKLTGNETWTAKTLRACMKVQTLDQILVGVHPLSVTPRQLEDRVREARLTEEQRKMNAYFDSLIASI